MSWVPVPTIEEAIAFKVRLWANDLLGVVEGASLDPDVKVGGTARPREYVRASDIMDVEVKQTPAVAVGLANVDNWRRQKTELWGTCAVEVGVRFGSSGRTSFDVGVGPRLYLQALGLLFDSPAGRDLGSGVRINGIVDSGIGDALRAPNGDYFSVASITLAVDAPLFDSAPLFDTPPAEIPAPGTPPRTPDVPATILTLITSVEAMT